MNTSEFDVLFWLTKENRPASQLVAMSAPMLSAWIRSHGGKTKHIDAVCLLRTRLQSRLRDLTPDAPNVLRFSK